MNGSGTRYEEREGKLTRIVDRTGVVHAELTWDGDALVRLEVPGAIVHGAVITDELLGRAHAIDHAPPAQASSPSEPARETTATAPSHPAHSHGGHACSTPPSPARPARATASPPTDPRATTTSAIDWARPTEIPAIAAPGLLPRGAGAAIMNVIAVLAARAGVPALRYAGPYPTHALWTTLRRSFRTTATEEAFTADAIQRAVRIARDPLPIDFVPAPHDRLGIERGHVELRERESGVGIDRVVIDGTSYEPDGSPARLVHVLPDEQRASADEYAAEIWFGDDVWAHIATLEGDGTLVEGPRRIPPCRSDVIGRAFPPALRAAIAELVADAVPAPLAADARALLATSALHWADLGAAAADHDPSGFRVHAALWDRIAPLGLARLALALAEALAPVVTRVVVGELTWTK
jgi:hypothetical protein